MLLNYLFSSDHSSATMVSCMCVGHTRESTYFHVDSFCHFRAYCTQTHIYSVTQTHTHTHTHTRICALYNYASRIEAHSPQPHKGTHTRRCDSLTPSLTYSHIDYTPTCLPSRHNSSCFACLFHKMKNEKLFSLSLLPPTPPACRHQIAGRTMNL